MQPFLALITPIGGGPVDPGYGVPGWPSHPIAPGGQPPRPWGPINYPDQGLPGQPGQPPRPWGPINYPDQGLPGNQPYPGQGLPGHQPYPDQGLPGRPPGTWGGSRPPYMDIGGPGPQPIPGWGPGFPTNPIVLPPYEPGGPPVQIWGPILYPDQGLPGAQPRPSHPIVYPPLPPPPEGGGVKPPPEDGGWGYTPDAGWGYFPGTGGEAGPKKKA